LLARRLGRKFGGDQVAVIGQHPLHRFRRLEFLRQDAHGNAGAAGFAGGTVGDVLRAAETALRQDIVHFGGAGADQMRKNLALHLLRQIRACSRCRQIKLRGWR